jgi:hypothetical protein
MSGRSTKSVTGPRRAGRGASPASGSSQSEKVVDAVRRDLESLARRDEALASGALAMSALALARSIDHLKTSATARSMCARALTETMEKLLALAPAEREEDGIDDLTARRAERRAGSSAATA